MPPPTWTAAPLVMVVCCHRTVLALVPVPMLTPLCWQLRRCSGCAPLSFTACPAPGCPSSTAFPPADCRLGWCSWQPHCPTPRCAVFFSGSKVLSLQPSWRVGAPALPLPQPTAVPPCRPPATTCTSAPGSGAMAAEPLPWLPCCGGCCSWLVPCVQCKFTEPVWASCRAERGPMLCAPRCRKHAKSGVLM